jgi:hypothetical protein
MQLGNFQKSWSQALQDNASKNFLIAALLALNAIAVVGWFRTEKTTVLVPPMHDETLEVSTKSASIGYKKAWALTVAQLAGNVTPGNAKRIEESPAHSPNKSRTSSATLSPLVSNPVKFSTNPPPTKFS